MRKNHIVCNVFETMYMHRGTLLFSSSVGQAFCHDELSILVVGGGVCMCVVL